MATTADVADDILGRELELARIAALLSEASSGRSGALLVSGDAGVGKTSLVRAAGANAGQEVLVLSGACLMLASTTVPFLAIRSLVRSCPATSSTGAPPGFDDAVPSNALVRFDGWLDRLCEDRTVMLIVDDLQWADGSTLDLLTYVVAGPAQRRLLVAATIRTGEVRDGDPAQLWIANARRLPRVREIALGPLDRHATTALLADLLGGPPHQSLVEDVWIRTAGNPYLVRLLAGGLDPADRRAPTELGDDLRSALLQAWSRLSPPARQLTRLLAVAGRPSHDLDLVAVAGVGTVPQTLAEAVSAGVVDVGPDGRYWFHHPMIAEVLDQDMPPDERRRWHAAFAEYTDRALGAHASSVTHLVALADHHHRAGHPREAYRWALRAADATEAAGGVSESVHLLRRAVRLREQLPDEHETRWTLLERIRRTAAAGGRYAEELEAVDDLLRELDPQASRLLFAELLVRRLHLRFISGHSFMLLADAAEAVRLAEVDRTSWQYALALAESAHALTWAADPTAAAAAEHALEVAREVGDARALSFALTVNAIHVLDGGRPLEARRLVNEAFDHALLAQDWFAVVHAALWLANAAGVWSSRPLAEVLKACRLQLALSGAPHFVLGWISAAEASSWLALGEPVECSQRLRVALGADPGPYADALARLVAARLAALQGRTGEAVAHLARVDELLDGGAAFVTLPFDAVSVEVVLAGGDPRRAYERAVDAVRRAVEVVPPTMSDWLVPLAARALADLVERAEDEGVNPAPTLVLLDAFRRRYPIVVRDRGLVDEQWALQLEAHGAWYDAEMGRAHHDPDNAEQWRRTASAFAAGGLLWEQLYATWRAAQQLLAGGYRGRDEAAPLIRQALDMARRVGCVPIRTELETLATSARIATDRMPDESITRSGTLSGLTPRETEILAYLVAGRTYREIARALVVSEKAVSSHVSNMLHKTGCANRLELASRAVRAGQSG